MSFRRRNKKKALGNKKKDPKPNTWQQDDGTGKTSGAKWTTIGAADKTNALYEKYYRELIPADEWEAFLECMRTDLPICFRAIPGNVLSQFVEREMQEQFGGDDPIEVEGERVQPPQRESWFPGGFLWRFTASRKQARKEERLAKFKKWLVGATEAGQVVRQEIVSMIPPILLDVHDGHAVFDACASPGSKTTQLLEAIHEHGPLSTGLVVANELDEKRARMLTHRLQAITSPNLIITNHDARMFPRLRVGLNKETGDGGEPLDFDRILCDVPCTGDGTLRKAVDLWQRWTPNMAKGIHLMQLHIAQRCIRMLKEGGRIVYSTCSLNPLENEAIVAELIRWSEGALRLVDCSHLLPGFKRQPGLTSWKVMGKDGEWIDTDHPECKVLPSSVWPPTSEEREQMHLERCWRIYPHANDTGGFFCALFEKVSALPRELKRIKRVEEPKADEKGKEEEGSSNNKVKQDEEEEDRMFEELETAEKKLKRDLNLNDADLAPNDELPSLPPPKEKEEANEGEKAGPAAATAGGEVRKKRVRRSYESPYLMVEPGTKAHETVKTCLEHYGLDLDPNRFMIRSEESQKTIFYVGGPSSEILPMDQVGRLHIMSAGLRIFVKQKRGNAPMPFRLSSECVSFVAPRMVKRVVPVSLEDAAKLVTAESVVFANLTEQTRASLEGLEQGSLVWRVVVDGVNIFVLGWLAKSSAQFQVPKEDKVIFSSVITKAAAREKGETKNE